MTNPTFNQPQSGGGFFNSKEHVGSLLLITKVHEVYHNAMNVYQGKPAPRDEAKVDVVDLDRGDLGYQLRERITMTHPGIVNRLSTGATNILGRLTMETGTNGDYYALQPYEDADVDKATRWVNWWTSQQMNQPQSAPQAPSQGQGMPQGQPGPGGGQAAPQAPQGQGYAQGGQVPQPGYGQQQRSVAELQGMGQQPQADPNPWDTAGQQGQQGQGSWGGAPSYGEPPF